MRRRVLFFVFAITAGCQQSANGPAETPKATTPTRPAAELFVPNGYEKLVWLSPLSRVQTAIPKAAPPDGRENILVHTRELHSHPATEVYFFNDTGQLVEVELRLNPKLTPTEAGELALWYDRQFGPHEVTRMTETRYQFVWSGADTEVFFTYDLTDAVPEAPLINFTYRNPQVTDGGPPPAEQFAEDALKALHNGWSVVDVVVGQTRFVLILGQGGQRQKLNLELDPKTGHTVGYKIEAPYSAGTVARAQREAERRMSMRFATIGGPVAVITKDKVTYAIWEDGSYVSLKPGEPDIFVSAAGSLPDFLSELALPTIEPMDTPSAVETSVP